MVAFLTQLLLAIRSPHTLCARLEAENLLLRQQLVVLRRKSPKRFRLWNIRSLAVSVAVSTVPVALGRDHHRPAGERDPLDANQSSGPSFFRSSPFKVDRRMPCQTVLTSAGASFPSSGRR